MKRFKKYFSLLLFAPVIIVLASCKSNILKVGALINYYNADSTYDSNNSFYFRGSYIQLYATKPIKKLSLVGLFDSKDRTTKEVLDTGVEDFTIFFPSSSSDKSKNLYWYNSGEIDLRFKTEGEYYYDTAIVLINDIEVDLFVGERVINIVDEETYNNTIDGSFKTNVPFLAYRSSSNNLGTGYYEQITVQENSNAKICNFSFDNFNIEKIQIQNTIYDNTLNLCQPVPTDNRNKFNLWVEIDYYQDYDSVSINPMMTYEYNGEEYTTRLPLRYIRDLEAYEEDVSQGKRYNKLGYQYIENK